MFRQLIFGLTLAGVISALPSAHATVFGSVEPLANTAVLNTQPLSDQPLEIRAAFGERLLACRVVDRVLKALIWTGGVRSINALNIRFSQAAGGFQGETNPAYVYTVIDSGPNAAKVDDIKILTNSLGFVFSQASAFLLDVDDPSQFDFPANYVVLNFAAEPGLVEPEQVFATVGTLDPELFLSETSGYTQYGRAYVSLQSAVPDAQFIAGYKQAAALLGLEYTPIRDGQPALFTGGAAFPSNDWVQNPRGESYLQRIPSSSHRVLRRIRRSVLRTTVRALRVVRHDNRKGFNPDDDDDDTSNARTERILHALSELSCR